MVGRMHRVVMRRFVACAALSAALAGLPVALPTPPPASAAPAIDVMAWAPYWESTDALNSFKQRPEVFSELTPFFWAAKSATVIDYTQSPMSASLSAYKTAAANAGKPIVATIVDGLGANQMAGILADPNSRAAHVDAIATFAANNGFSGIDIDYEQFAFADARSSWPTTFDAFGAFMAELSTRLHTDGRTLAVAVPPIYDNAKSSSSGYWVYNYPALAQYVDRIRIMTYSYSGNSAGAIAPYQWVSNSIDAALKVPGMAAAKVVMGIAAYGNDVVTKIDGSCPKTVTSANELKRKSVTAATVAAHAARKGVTPTWGPPRTMLTVTGLSDPQEKVYEYVDSFNGPDASGATVLCNIYRKVFYSDAEAIYRRVQLAQSKGIAGVGIWALGYDDTATWDAIAAARAGQPWTPPAPLAPNPQAPAVVAPYPIPIFSAGPLPGRFLDTRAGQKTADGLMAGGGRQEAGEVLTLQIAGRGAIAKDAKAVTLNVTAVGEGTGFVTVYPCDAPRPLTSNLNVRNGQVISNSVITRLSATGTVCLYNQSPAQLLVDVFNVLPAATFAPTTAPARLADTRVGEQTIDGQVAGVGPVQVGTALQVQVAGRGGVPAGAKSAVLNVTSVGAGSNGYLTVWPCDGPQPLTSNVNFTPGAIAPNAVVTALSATGTACIFASNTTDVVVDVFGALDPVKFSPLPAPVRLLETRTGLSTIDGQSNAVGKMSAASTIEVPIAARGALPETPDTVILNVTVDQTELAGFVTVYPCGTARPLVSNVNFAPQQTLPNLVVTTLSANGSICVYSNVKAHVVVDAFGSLDI